MRISNLGPLAINEHDVVTVSHLSFFFIEVLPLLPYNLIEQRERKKEREQGRKRNRENDEGRKRECEGGRGREIMKKKLCSIHFTLIAVKFIKTADSSCY